MKKTVAIIGCGVSGLVSIKEALQCGLEPICFEQKSGIGGLWLIKNPSKTECQVYEEIIQNTAKFGLCFSDFTHKKEIPLMMNQQATLAYIMNAYADNFELKKHIHFNSPSEMIVNSVIVASGYYSKGEIPKIIRLDKFRGTKFHTGMISNMKPYNGKTVLIVGSSLSGIDFASHIAPNAKQIKSMFQQISRQHFDLKAMNLNPDKTFGFKKGGSIASPNGFEMSLYFGRIQVIRAYLESVDKESVYLSNGDQLFVDDIIFATGYSCSLPFIEDNLINLHDFSYLYLCPIEQEHRTFFTIGLAYFAQTTPCLFELMARAACGIIADRINLLSKKEMYKWLNITREMQMKFCGEYSNRVCAFPHRHDLAKLIGCFADLEKIGEKNPELAEISINEPILPAHYRLLGPDSKWETAEKEIRAVHCYYSKGGENPDFPWMYTKQF